MAVTAAMVKELRTRTGAGMMECKKALVETDGDIAGRQESRPSSRGRENRAVDFRRWQTGGHGRSEL
jgi:hypothetical protein